VWCEGRGKGVLKKNLWKEKKEKTESFRKKKVRVKIGGGKLFFFRATKVIWGKEGNG